MVVALQAIQFCWNPLDASSSALKIRRNANTPVQVPEWQRGVHHTTDSSVALYAVKPTLGKTVLIRAKFIIIPDASEEVGELQIRAIQPPIRWGAAGNPFINPFVQIAVSTQVNVLGEVKAKTVTTNAIGETEWEFFELVHHRLALRGVGIQEVEWHWQYRTAPTEPWIHFQTTNHKIYTVLDVPTAPWVQTPHEDIHLPWTDVLDYACFWGAGARHVDEAATFITRSVYHLGPERLEYNCSNFLPGFVILIGFEGDSYFDCTLFLAHLRTGLINRYVICSDCASIVSTFANILGCDLWQSRMYIPGSFFFRVNPILVIGKYQWQFPCGSPGFSFHEVAWKDDCTEDDEVFDACLTLDSDLSPSSFPFWPFIATNIPYGRPGSGFYRDRLVFPPDIRLCRAQPGERQRRKLIFLPNVLLQPREVTASSNNAMAKEFFNFSAWADQNLLPQQLFIVDFIPDDQLLADWDRVYFSEKPFNPQPPSVIVSLWRSPIRLPGAGLRIDFYECPSLRMAHEFLIRLLAEAHIKEPYQRANEVGDIAFTTSGKQTLLFARGNLVVMLANIDRQQVQVMPLAQQIDQKLIEKPPTPLDSQPLSWVGPERNIKPGESLPLSWPASNRKGTASQPTYFRLFADDGAIYREGDTLFYSPSKDSNFQIALYETPARTRG